MGNWDARNPAVNYRGSRDAHNPAPGREKPDTPDASGSSASGACLGSGPGLPYIRRGTAGIAERDGRSFAAFPAAVLEPAAGRAGIAVQNSSAAKKEPGEKNCAVPRPRGGTQPGWRLLQPRAASFPLWLPLSWFPPAPGRLYLSKKKAVDPNSGCCRCLKAPQAGQAIGRCYQAIAGR